MERSDNVKYGPPSLSRKYQKIVGEWTSKAALTEASALTITNQLAFSWGDCPLPVPPGFVYVENCYIFDDDIEKPDAAFLVSCACEESCNTNSCACLALTGIQSKDGDFERPYDDLNRLTIEVAPGVEINECNDECSCLPYFCGNRGSQHARQIPMDIFFKLDRTWGVRPTVKIRKNTVVGIHTGLLVKRSKEIAIEDSNYCFNLDHNEILGDPDGPKPLHELFTVYSKNHGNWSRFLTHSPNPNLETFMATYDVPSGCGMPYVVFFAKHTIYAYSELTINYNINLSANSPLSLSSDVQEEE